MDCQLQIWTIDTDNDEECIKKMKHTCAIDKFIITKKTEYLKPTKKYPNIFHGTATSTWKLDVSKNKFSYVEKYIYDIATFHLKRMNVVYVPKKHVIQFWFKHKDECYPRALHVDFYTDYDKKTEDNAFLSTVTYFDDDDMPTLFTNLTEDIAHTEDFANQNKICFSFPKPLKHAFFLGKQYFHGHWQVFSNAVRNSKRDMLVIKVWDELDPDFVDNFDNEFYSFKEEYDAQGPSIIKFKPDNRIKYIYMKDHTLINPELYKQFIASKINKECCYPFGELILKNEYDKYDTFIFEVNPEKYVEPPTTNATNMYAFSYFYALLFILFIGIVCYLYKTPEIIAVLHNSILPRNSADIPISTLTLL
jgi:hypothetical protein